MKIVLLIVVLIVFPITAYAGEGVFKKSKTLMGTEVDITVVSADEKKAYTAIEAAFAEIRRIEELMSTYIPESQISKINSAAGKKAVKVDEELIRLIKRAIEYAEMTEGGFNIAVGPLIKLWKVAEGGNIPGSEEIKRAKEIINYKDIVVEEKKSAVYLRKKGMAIDLGGIAKGYASDRAEIVLKKNGIISGIVAVAGDINAFGKKADGNKWRIGIQHPRKKDAFLGIFELEDEAVSTSGDYERFFIKDGKRYHHIIDTKTGVPAGKCQSVTIVAKEATATDALSTGIFVMGPEKGMELIERLSDVEGIIIDAKGNIAVSSGLKNRIKDK
jgi:thiamine biosynthesis lipoprotein